MALKIDAKFEGKLTCAFRNDMRNLVNFHRLKNNNFILESKVPELNQSKNSKQLDRCSEKTLFYLGNKWITQLTKLFTKSLLLRYKKIFKKAVKIGSFLQCWEHIFLGHAGCFWKINLRIFWNHTMKNFQVMHGQRDSIIFPKRFSLESSK